MFYGNIFLFILHSFDANVYFIHKKRFHRAEQTIYTTSVELCISWLSAMVALLTTDK